MKQLDINFKWMLVNLYLLFLVVSPLNAAVLLEEPKTNIQFELAYYIDNTSNRDIDDINSIEDTEWLSLETEQVNLGFDEKDYWFKTELYTKQSKDRLLEIAYPLLDNIDLYILDQGKVVNYYQTGDRYLFNKRLLDHRNFLFPLKIKPNEVLTVYIHVKTSGALQLPIYAWEKNSFLLYENKVNLFQGAFIGIMFVMCLYNLFIFSALRDKSYLIYVGVVLSTGLVQTSLQGLTYQYLWPNSSWWNGQSIAVLTLISLIFVACFSISFLKLQQKAYQLYQIFKLMSILMCFTAFINIFIPFYIGISLSRFFGVIIPLLVLFAGIYCWIKGDMSARYFIIAWALLAVGTLVMVFAKSGILASNLYTENAMAFGFICEVILLSLALAHKFSDERRKRSMAQENLLISERELRKANEERLQLQLQSNEKLERKVKGRTLELETTMSQLSEANTMLRNLSAKDGLTGIHNRRSFDERFDLEWKRAIRSKTQLALIMIDIDHFKNLNDQYGHQAGDECLKKIAEVLKDSIHRPGDFTARYGGEEFVVILPEMHKDGVVFFANKLRKSIAALAIKYHDKVLNITASLGICIGVPYYNEDLHHFIELADRALYRAKEKGRNRIELKLNSDEAEYPSNNF